MNLLAQIPENTQMPTWGWIAIALVGSAGFWGWLKAYTNKKFGLVGKLMDQQAALQQQVGALTEKMTAMKEVESKQLRRIEKIENAYRWLARISLREINGLRTKLKMETLTQWPPPRPVSPNAA